MEELKSTFIVLSLIALIVAITIFVGSNIDVPPIETLTF